MKLKLNVLASAIAAATMAQVVFADDTTIKPYGFIRLDAIHDFLGQPPEKFSDLDKQPLNSADPIHGTTQMTVATTRLGADFSTATDIGEVKGKVEGDFWGAAGTGSTFRFRHAYLTTGNWLFGHTWSPFTSVEMLPDVVDWNAPSGTSSIRRVPQIRYTTAAGTGNTVMVALEQTVNTNSQIPVLTGKFEHKTTAGSLFNVRAMAQQIRDGSATKNTYTSGDKLDTANGYGLALGTLLKLTPNTTVTAQVASVKGCSGSFVYGCGTDYKTVSEKVLLGELMAADIGITQKFTPKVRGTLVLSGINFDKNTDFAKANTGSNKSLQQLSVNTIYEATKVLNFGVEYTYGKRETFAGDEGTQSHLDLMARYKF